MSEVDSAEQTQQKIRKPKKKIDTFRMADESAADCLFERLRLHQQRAPDSTEVARAITARINSRLTSHDKHVRQSTLEKIWDKQTGALQMLVSILETSRDSATCTYITSILREALCLKQGKGKKCSEKAGPKEGGGKKKDIKKRGKENKGPVVKKGTANSNSRQECQQYFIEIYGTDLILRLLLGYHSKRDSNVNNEAMVHDLVWILASVANKDPKFAVKVRLLGCVRTMHLILKGHFTDNKMIFPLLVIMKQLAKNNVTTSILIRDGVITTYERVLVSLGFIPTARLRLCLDAVDYFSKNKVCCMQIVKTGLCTVLLRVFDRWDRYEGRMRLKICAHILQTLQHLCNIKAGRRALCTKKHVQTLHRFCSHCPDEPEFDGLLARVCSVITLCLKHQALPVPFTSPAMFNLNPILKGTNASWPCHEDEDEGEAGNSDSKTVNSDTEDDTQDDDLEGAEEFPDFETDENEPKIEPTVEEAGKILLKGGDSVQSSIWINPNERDIEDLKKYFIFFKEFGTYNKQLKLVRSRSNSRGSILDDVLTTQSTRNFIPNNPNMSLTACGINECEIYGGSSPQASTFQNYYRVHETPYPPPWLAVAPYPVDNSLRRRSSKNMKSKIKLYFKLLKNFFGAVRRTEKSSLSSISSCDSITNTSCSSLKIHKDISKYSPFSSVYCTISSRVRSVIPFIKVAYPDMTGGQSQRQPEPLNKMERTACRNKLLSCVDRAINPEAYMNEVVFDLDLLCSTAEPKGTDFYLCNNDEAEVAKTPTFNARLSFESRFESGNLRKAIQVGPREYELILMPDVNSNKRHQWFYFEVRNMQQGRPYIFNIVNCEKSDSQFNFGMKPVLYSVKEAILGRPGWVRAGTDICYYRNSYHYANQKNHSKCYLTVTFNIEFPHSNDVCYLAYHFPFTYSMMMARIWQWSLQMPPSTYLRVEPLCYSLNNNEVPLITVSAEDNPTNPIVFVDVPATRTMRYADTFIVRTAKLWNLLPANVFPEHYNLNVFKEREIIFLSARVHPGESNASWVMDGTLGCVLGDTPAASALRSKYVFKIVPMLNVEGVINGW